MGCRRYQRFAGLNRKGELSEREAAALAAHLRECPACAREAASMEELRQAVGMVRNMSCEPVDPDALTMSIVRRIANEHPPRPHASVGVILDRLLRIAALPAFRVASACVLLVAVGSFFWQSTTVIQELRQLEGQQAGLGSGGASALQVGYAVDRPVMDEIRATGLVRHRDVRAEGDAFIISGRALAFIQDTERLLPSLLTGQPQLRKDLQEARVRSTQIRSGIRPVLCFSIAEGV
jgi:hypothetical protein